MLKLLALAGVGYAGYRYFQNQTGTSRVAFAGNQGAGTIRDAGPEAMRASPSTWSKTDEEGDRGFPASGPPANC